MLVLSATLAVAYQSASGGLAEGTSEDVAVRLTVSDGLSGKTVPCLTAAGVDANEAKDDVDLILAAYPDIEIARHPNNSRRTLFTESNLGIEFGVTFDSYTRRNYVSVSVFVPEGGAFPDPAAEENSR